MRSAFLGAADGVCPAELSHELLLWLLGHFGGSLEALLVVGEAPHEQLPVPVFTLETEALMAFQDLCGGDTARTFLVRYEVERLTQIFCQGTGRINLAKMRQKMHAPGAALLGESDALAGLKLHLRGLTGP